MINLFGGIDIGNGYVKAAITTPDGNVEEFDIPSGVAIHTFQTNLPTEDTKVRETLAEDFYNNLNVRFSSSLIQSKHTYIFGKKALNARGQKFEEFDLESGISKAEQELSHVLILGVLAAKAVKTHFDSQKDFPTNEIVLNASISLSLPINEYREHSISFSSELQDSSHIVIVQNFETPVSVKITFTDVKVFPEGSATKNAFDTLALEFSESLLEEAQLESKYMDITPEMIFESQNTLGIDIGEGTVNFPIHTDGVFNADISKSFHKGYGTVLLNSLDALSQQKFRFDSRRALSQYLLTPPSPMKQGEYDQISAIVHEYVEIFASEIGQEFRKIFKKISPIIEVIYVFGGGANPMRKILEPSLSNIITNDTPVFFLDEQRSRYLNRDGLLQTALSGVK